MDTRNQDQARGVPPRRRDTQLSDQLETLPLDEASFGISVPNLSQVIIGTLSIFSIIVTWRVAAYLVNAVHAVITGAVLLPKGYEEIGAWGALIISAKWMCITILLLSVISLIAHFSKHVHIRLNARGIAIACSAVILWQLGAAFLVYWVESKHIPSTEAFFGGIVSAIVGFLVLASGARQFSHARQHMALSAEDVLSTDPRPAILYLRSFSQDDQRAPGDPDQPSHMFRPSDRVALPGFWLNRRHMTFEEWLCKAMQTIAPVVTIGKPGEPLPRLGAARKYVSNHSWQAEVLRLFEITQFTCLVLGSSEGLQWELKTVMNQGNPKKVLLVFPQNTNPQYIWGSFINNIYGCVNDRVLPKNVPSHSLGVVFSRDWRPILVIGRQRAGNYRKLTKLMVRHAGTN